MSTDSIQVCIPTAPCRTEARQQRRRLDTLSGKIVGFVDNSKPNFNFLVEDMASLLVTRYGVKSTIVRRKPSAAYAASESVLHDLVAQCDVVVSGSGD